MVYRVKKLLADELWITRGDLLVTPLTRRQPLFIAFSSRARRRRDDGTVGGNTARMFGGVVKDLRLSL
jgi:hypothetical protein